MTEVSEAVKWCVTEREGSTQNGGKFGGETILGGTFWDSKMYIIVCYSPISILSNPLILMQIHFFKMF